MSQQTFTGEGAIEAGANAADGARSTLSSIVSNLQGQMEGIRPMFQGAAADSFQRAMASWSENAEKIVSTLDQFSRDLRGTQTDFVNTDDDSASNLNSVEAANSEINFTYPGA